MAVPSLKGNHRFELWNQRDIPTLRFGRDTPLMVSRVTADYEIVTGDSEREGEDGRRAGKDRHSGYTMTFEMFLQTWVGNGLDYLGPFQKLWRQDSVRKRSDEYSFLKYTRADRTRWVWGRARKFTPIWDNADRGEIPVIATFDMMDDLFYDETEEMHTVGLITPSSGGFSQPLVEPITSFAVSFDQSGFHVADGEANVEPWCRTTFHGPITNPKANIVDKMEIALVPFSLGFSDQAAVVSSYPWDRYAQTNQGVQVAGLLSAATPRMTELKLPLGDSILRYEGTDPTGTSSVDLQWFNASATF